MSRDILNLVNIGSTGKTFGYKGALLLFVKDEYESLINEGDYLFVEREGNRVPYNLESVMWANECRIKFRHVNSMEEAKLFTSSNVFIEAIKIIDTPENDEIDETWNALVNYRLIDQNNNDVGEIIRIEEYSHQILAFVRLNNNKDVIVPIHEELIIDLDRDQNRIQIEIAEGLLEL